MWKSAPSRPEYWRGRHRFEHWYRDKTVYFITARCRDRFPAFASEAARAVFWDRFYHWGGRYGFKPWVTTLLDNHYHTEGYLEDGRALGEMMRRIHGSVAKLVNDLLPDRRVPFWRDTGSGDYFDGCIRDERQCRRAFGYTRRQSVRHRICRDWRDYPHTRVDIELDRGVRRALQLHCFLPTVPYKRYDGNPKSNPKSNPGRGADAAKFEIDFDVSNLPDFSEWDEPDEPDQRSPASR